METEAENLSKNFCGVMRRTGVERGLVHGRSSMRYKCGVNAAFQFGVLLPSLVGTMGRGATSGVATTPSLRPSSLMPVARVSIQSLRDWMSALARAAASATALACRWKFPKK